MFDTFEDLNPEGKYYWVKRGDRRAYTDSITEAETFYYERKADAMYAGDISLYPKGVGIQVLPEFK